jgi:hypothetical protein
MSTPISIRFDPDVLERLRRHAAAIPGATPSGLAQRLVDEGLRLAEHSSIVFKDGPSGRRAALRYGPDIWELIKFLREIDERGQAAIDAAVEVMALPEAEVRAGLRYYAHHKAEVDSEIEASERYSVEAEQAWLREQELLR